MFSFDKPLTWLILIVLILLIGLVLYILFRPRRRP